MKNKELALKISSIPWVAVQCDDIHENHNVYELLQEVEKLPKEHAVRLLLFVIEAISLNNEFRDDKTNPFKDMLLFENIDSKFTHYISDPY